MVTLRMELPGEGDWHHFLKSFSQGMAHRKGNEAFVPTRKGAWFTTGIQEIVGFWSLSSLEWTGCLPLGGELV